MGPHAQCGGVHGHFGDGLCLCVPAAAGRQAQMGRVFVDGFALPDGDCHGLQPLFVALAVFFNGAVVSVGIGLWARRAVAPTWAVGGGGHLPVPDAVAAGGGDDCAGGWGVAGRVGRNGRTRDCLLYTSRCV